jgi:hypothetical protein
MTLRARFALPALAAALLAGCATKPEVHPARFFVDVRGMEQQTGSPGDAIFTRAEADWSTINRARPLSVLLSYTAEDPTTPLTPEEIHDLRDTWAAAVESAVARTLPLHGQSTPDTILVKVELRGLTTRRTGDGGYALKADGATMMTELRHGENGTLWLAAEQPLGGIGFLGLRGEALTPEQRADALTRWAAKVSDLLVRQLRQ